MTKSPGSAPKRSKSSATRCGGDTLASIKTSREREPLIAAFDQHHLRAAMTAWQGQAHAAQVPPAGHWSTWLFLGGRGAGKTWAGAQWLSARADEAAGRFALVGPTLHDVREVMVEGPSGLKAVAPRDRRPVYESSRRRLLWPSGAMAYAFSAEDPESLRGPQFHAAWADEFCAWRRPAQVLAMLRLGLRLGPRPRLIVTTTPKSSAALRTLMAEPTCVQSRAATSVNAEHLAPTFLEGLHALYGGTRLAAQELDGLITEADGDALWRAADLLRCRGSAPPRFEAVVVAVDPPATSSGDACGIVAVGREGRCAYVLADRSVAGLSPLGWAARVVETVALCGAARVVAEVNQGGDMVRSVLAAAGCPVAIRAVHASRSKRARAAPVAALYEQGRVIHTAAFPALEEEMMAFGVAEGGRSPDRVDALVWAVTDLMLGRDVAPRMRML